MSIETQAIAASQGRLTFLGRGIVRPFQRDKKNDFANAEGAVLIQSNVGQILGTKASSARAPGELPWRTEFGSRFHLLRHRNDTEALQDLAVVYAQEALGRWEPRVRLTDARVARSPNPRELIVRIRYSIIDAGGSVLARDLDTNVPVFIEG